MDGVGVASVDDDLPVAATVVLVRDGADGPEVLLLLRPQTQSFGGAWVFPGGRIEPGDEAEGGDELTVARRAGARETHEECGLLLDPDALVPISVWNPPRNIPKRIRTWFFVAVAPDAPLALAADEVVRGEWLTPAEMLRLHGAGGVTLFPPTFVTLTLLVGFADVDAMLADARAGEVEEFSTRPAKVAGVQHFVWGVDTGADDVPAADRHRLIAGDLPWSYQRG